MPTEEAFTPETWKELEAEIVASLGSERIVTPAMVQSGYPSLRVALAERGWPKIATLRGKVLLLLLNQEEETASYQRARSQLEHQLFFASVQPENDDAGWFRLPDPENDGVREMVKRGFLATVQADTHTEQARNTDFTRSRLALASGAQFVLTDFPLPDQRFPGYQVNFLGGRFVRCNPVRFHGRCPL